MSGTVPGSRYSFRPALTAGGGGGATASGTPAMGLLTAPGTLYVSKYAPGSAAGPGASTAGGAGGAYKSSYAPISPGIGLATPGLLGLGASSQYGGGGAEAYGGEATPAPGRGFGSIVPGAAGLRA